QRPREKTPRPRHTKRHVAGGSDLIWRFLSAHFAQNEAGTPSLVDADGAVLLAPSARPERSAGRLLFVWTRASKLRIQGLLNLCYGKREQKRVHRQRERLENEL